MANEIFQKRLNQALEWLDGLLTVHDDMVINRVGDTKERATADHNRKLRQFLQLNKKKLNLLCNEIPYMGHLVTAEGLKPDPEKSSTQYAQKWQCESCKKILWFC